MRIKPRERSKLNWDDKLTIEINGDRPQCAAIRIEPDHRVPTLFLTGNSTVVDQDEEPWASWGQMIPRFFDAEVCFANYAESGECADTFIRAGRLKKALSQMKPGDYMFMEFGHNDQKQKGPGRGAYYSFATSLKTFIDEVRQCGGHPVLVTPTCRRAFKDGKIQPTHADYPDAVHWVAEREQVPLIDLQEMTRVLFEALGEEGSKRAFVHYPAGTYPGQDKALADNTVDIETSEGIIAIAENDNALVINSLGMKEYQILQNTTSQVALTLFKSTGVLGRDDLAWRPGRASGINNTVVYTPEAQLHKPLIFNLMPCIYADVAGFSSGLVRVQEGMDSVRRYGYVDTLGQVVIPLKYDYARDFSEGMAVVAKGEWSGKSGYGKRDFEFTGKYGFIDRRGNEVIAPIYDGAADFSEVLAAVGQMGKYYVRWGFIDAAGTLVIPCKYYEVSSFRNGRAVVCIVSGGALKYGSIDRNGREILPCIYDWVQHTPFGTTWVGEGEDFASRACTLLDVSGKPLIDYKVYQVNPSGKFGHASAAVPDSTGLLRFGVLDGRGRVIVPFEYDDITIFSEWDSAAAAYVERGIAEVKGKKYPFALRRGE